MSAVSAHATHDTSDRAVDGLPATPQRMPQPSAGAWFPPQELQRCFVHRQGKSHVLFFAIELKTKDYLRRIFDALALGIQETVQRVVSQHRDSIAPIGSKKRKYDFAHMCDLHYLVKHVAHPRSAPVYAAGAVLTSYWFSVFVSPALSWHLISLCPRHQRNFAAIWNSCVVQN